MIYSEIILNNNNNLERVKTGNLSDFNLVKHNNSVNNSFSDNETLHWIMTQTPFQRTVIQGENFRKEVKVTSRKRKKLKRKQKRRGKIKKWMLKLLKRIKKKERYQFGIKSKYMIPLILGLLVAKSLFILIALNAITFISTKGLMMGYFSTALASIVSLRSAIERSHVYQNRMDKHKTQVEIIKIPSKNHEHIYYDDYYKNRDSVRMLT